MIELQLIFITYYLMEKVIINNPIMRFSSIEQLSLSKINEMLVGNTNIRQINGHFKF